MGPIYSLIAMQTTAPVKKRTYSRRSTRTTSTRGLNRVQRSQVVRLTRGMMEKKFLDSIGNFNSSSGALAITNTSKIISLTDVEQGITDSQRIGDKTKGTSLEFRIVSFSPELSSVSTKEWMIRCTIFVWKDDSIPVANTDLYGNSGSSGVAANQPSIWPYNHDKKVKRHVLEDFTFVQFLDANSDTFEGCENPYYTCQKIIPLTRLKQRLNEISFQAATTTGYNKIWCMLTSNQTEFEATWNVSIWARYNYIDA